MRNPDDLVGRTIGAYSLVEKIGEGGMATVYKAYQSSLKRFAAVKVLRGELATNQDFITRFQREALSVAHLSHPNILHVYDAGVAEGRYYIIMDYVDGGSLKDLLDRRALGVEEAVAIAIQLADALDYAHRHGVIHRDVKPANIMMAVDSAMGGAARPVLGDFGIAKALYESQSVTRTGTAIGTPEYMAPEQFVGGVVDGRADVYSLGIVLYEMLAGHPPFSAPTPISILYKQANEPPTPLRQAAGMRPVPAWLEVVVERALAKRPDERYQRAGDLAEDLRRGGQGAPAYVEPAAPAAGRGQAETPAGGRGRAVTPVTPAHGWTEPMAAPPTAPARRRANPVPILAGLLVVVTLMLAAGVAYVATGGRIFGAGATPTKVLVTRVVTTAPEKEATLIAVVQSPEPSAAVATAVPTKVPTQRPAPTDVPPAKTVPPTRAPSPAPTATAAPTRTAPRPTARPTAPQAPGEPGLLADFESWGTWKRGDQANGTFRQSSEQAHTGRYSGRLDYQFGTAENDFVVFLQSHAIANGLTRLTAWVYGDGSGHFFNAWIKDKAGEIWQVPLGTVTHQGWQQMSGVVDPGQGWPWQHVSGPENGVVDFPISFAALVLDDKPDPYTGSGTIYIDDVRAEEGGGPVGGATPQPTTVGGGPTAVPTSAPAAVSGRIAYSVQGKLHVADAQTGQDRAVVANMRQPDFHAGGQLIIANGEGGGQDSLWTVRAGGGLDAEQSTHPDDFFPFFSPVNGPQFVFDSARGGKGQHNLYIGTLGDRKRDDERQAVSYGSGAIIGSRPVWLGDDRLVYTGCDYGFGGGGNCGLYVVPSWGGVPRLVIGGGLTVYATDAYGTRVLMTSQHEGNWEVYIIGADGGGLKNLSASGSSQDGLGTFSPDGKLVAFMSNRGGGWAMWVVRPDGTGLGKLFDLAAPPAGVWTEERISWGP